MWGKFCSLNKSNIKVTAIMLLSFTLLCQPLFSQKPGRYYYKPKLDIAFGVASLGSIGAFYLAQQSVRPLNSTDIAPLQISSIPAFDREAVYHYDIGARKLSNMLIYGTFVAKAAIFYGKKSRSHLFEIGLVGYQSLFMAQAFANGFKLSDRIRPYVYNPNVSISDKINKDARFSFFSAHTTTMSALCFTAAYGYRLYYPDSKYKKWVWAAAITLPAVEGYLRVKSGKHFPSDVLTGYLVGLGTSYIMHKLHQ
jgi:membrane-associated phospholipid phosphatase